jgi:predicted nucleic acid-binding protein
VEGLLKNKELLSKDHLVSPELALYEVANAIWKHEHLIKDLDNGTPYISIFYGLVATGKIILISPDESLMQQSYLIAKRNDITMNDALFVALATKLGLTLRTFDKIQSQALKSVKETR